MSVPPTTHQDATAPAAGSTRRPNRFGQAPRVLTTAPVAFAALVAATLGLLAASGLDQLTAATSEQYSAILLPLIGRELIFLLAIGWGAAGIVGLLRRMSRTGPRSGALIVGGYAFTSISLLCCLSQVIALGTAAGFSTTTFGETAGYRYWFVATFVTLWSAVVAAGLTALALRTGGIRPGFTLILAIACALYLVVDVITRGGVPPFGLAFVWLTMGVGLRASRVPS